MAFRQHNIQLSILREGEKVLHNCSSHWLIHLKLPLLFLVALGIPFLAVLFLVTGEVITDPSAVSTLWMLYCLYGLIMTTAFWIRTINFELGGCVITNQRVLRFGYKGLSSMVEREILPHKIEDVKVVKRGVMSMFFDAADVVIHTSNNEVEKLLHVMQSKKIQEIFSQMLTAVGNKAPVAEASDEADAGTTWIDDALGTTHGEAFDADVHREETIGQIGEVFRGESEANDK